METAFYETDLCPDPELPLLLHKCLIDSEVLPHWHTNIELLYIQEGEMIISIDGQEHSALVGDIMLINSNCLHTFRTITPTSRYRCLIIEETFINQHQLDYTLVNFQTKINQPDILTLYLKMMAEFDQQRPCYKPMLQGMCLEMMSLLFRELNYSPLPISQRAPSNAKVELTKLGIDYISHHYQKTIAIDDICLTIGVSKFHFCRIFKEVTELTVNEFINHFRCTRAQILLQKKGAVIADCGLACGFNDPSYFAKIYRKHFGYLPSVEISKTQTP